MARARAHSAGMDLAELARRRHPHLEPAHQGRASRAALPQWRPIQRHPPVRHSLGRQRRAKPLAQGNRHPLPGWRVDQVRPRRRPAHRPRRQNHLEAAIRRRCRGVRSMQSLLLLSYRCPAAGPADRRLQEGSQQTQAARMHGECSKCLWWQSVAVIHREIAAHLETSRQSVTERDNPSQRMRQVSHPTVLRWQKKRARRPFVSMHPRQPNHAAGIRSFCPG